jgi:hypothetical protein
MMRCFGGWLLMGVELRHMGGGTGRVDTAARLFIIGIIVPFASTHLHGADYYLPPYLPPSSHHLAPTT